MIRVLIVDDHAIVRSGLTALLATTSDLEVIGEAVDGTEAVAEAAAAAGVRRLVLASTTAVYGPTGAQPASEDTAPAPDSWYAESKLEAERVARAVGRRTGLEIVVLRLSAVYGPRVRGNYRRLLRAMARGRFVSIGRALRA